jgi:hypothetical protein
MEELHLSTGDVIEISSKAAKKKTLLYYGLAN